LVRATAGDAAQTPQRYAVLKAIFDEMQECPATAYETKAGFRPCKTGPKEGVDRDIVAKLTDLPGTKALVKKMLKHIATEPWGTIAFEQDPKTRKVAKLLKSSYESMLTVEMALPDTEWAKQVYRFEGIAQQKWFTNSGAAHLGCTECRLAVTGCEEIVCIPWNSTPGLTFEDKRRWLIQAGGQDLADVIKKGNKVVNDGTGLVVIPSGVMCVSICTDETISVRWSVGGAPDDTVRVKQVLRSMIESAQEMSGSALHRNFLAFLESA